MQSSNAPAKFTIPFANSAGAGYITYPVPTASQIAVTPGAASLTDGFPPLTMTPTTAGGVGPLGQDFNGLLKQVTDGVRWMQAGFSPVYDSTFSAAIGGYPKGAVLRRADNTGWWVSTAENNTSNPDTGGANWSAMGVRTADFTGGQSLGTNGYQIFPGGLMIQWGIHANTANSEVVTFPKHFTVACYNVQTTGQTNSGSSVTNTQASAYTTTGFTLYAASVERPTAWLAIGK